MRQPACYTMDLPINTRKWLINRFVEQKEKETQEKNIIISLNLLAFLPILN